MSKKIARITQEKKLLLANEVVESNAKTSLNSDGRLDTDELIEYPAELEGGRNLILNSRDIQAYTRYRTIEVQKVDDMGFDNVLKVINTATEPTWGYITAIYRDLTRQPEFGEQATLSLFVRGIPYEGETANLSVYYNEGTYSQNFYNVAKEYKWLSVTFDVKSDSARFHIYPTDFKELYIAYAKLEIGNKPTPWTPAPEDLGLNYPDSIQNFNSSISGNNIIAPEFIEGYPFVKPVIDDSLVLWLDGSTGNNYEQTGTWKDLSGNGNDGQLVNFGYTEDSGWVGDGLRFDGVDDYVNCGNNGSLNITDGLTIEIMCKNDERDLSISVTKGQNGRWADNSFGLRTHIFYISDKAGNLNQLQGVRPQQGKFNHIICRTSQKLGKLEAYINGVKVAEMTRTIDDIKITNQNVHINTRFNGGERDKGEVKLVRIYNRALTDEEILQNYQAGQCSPLLAMRGDAVG